MRNKFISFVWFIWFVLFEAPKKPNKLKKQAARERGQAPPKTGGASPQLKEVGGVLVLHLLA